MHAVQWTRDEAGTYTLVDLGPAAAGSSSAGINDEGRVVGHASAAPGEPAKANTWVAGGVTTPLTLDAELGTSEAYAINAGNQVVGINGVQAFIAAPR